MILITGGSGFIGSNLIRHLNFMGRDDIIILDNFKNGKKFLNINDLHFLDLYDKDFFYKEALDEKMIKNITKIVHLGACSSTQEWNGEYLLKTNYENSKHLLHLALENNIDFIYASSASVYGDGLEGFDACKLDTKPLNAYAFSKLIFDRYVNNYLSRNSCKQNVVGLRFFNVYGPGEAHKGAMTSPVYNFFHQIKETGTCKVFEEIRNGVRVEHLRDFVHVDDCSKIITHFINNQVPQRLINVGTGSPSSFLKVAELVMSMLGKPRSEISFIEFPEILKGRYQSYTCADLSSLRSSGYRESFIDLDLGVDSYVRALKNGS